ncbi:MAG: nucleotide exchange factor GrpE [Oligoflexia bacterium]|nr:nucleotide exchange factor GrpE [Oligoflexia bacterium]
MAFGKKKKDSEGEPLEARDADFSTLDGEESSTPNGASAEAAGAAEEELFKLREELKDSQDKYLRLLAEFDNYKKRAIKERAEILKYQGERIFVDILDIVDNLELALQHKDSDPAKLRAGVELIYKMFMDVLARWEVRGESAIGKLFDPGRQNAISRVELEDKPPGTVVSELKKTYSYKDKLLRLGEVVVAAAREPEEPGESDPGEKSES